MRIEINGKVNRAAGRLTDRFSLLLYAENASL
jgi:hypothetical protein